MISISMEYRRRSLQSYHDEETPIPLIQREHHIIHMSLDEKIEQQMNYLYHHPMYVVKVGFYLLLIVFVLYYSKKIAILL